MDWSGTSYQKKRGMGPDFYIPCIAGFPCTLETLTEAFREAKTNVGLSQAVEIHAHDLPEEILTVVLKALVNLEMRVGARILDKGTAEYPCGRAALPAPIDFAAEAALSIMRPFAAHYEISRIWYDRDIQGQKREKEFETAVKRLSRERWQHGGLKIRSADSDKSVFIQAADAVGYGLRRLAMNAIEHRGLQGLMRQIKQDENNIIAGPEAWED